MTETAAPFDPRQALVELIGFSGYLRARKVLLFHRHKEGRITPKEGRELMLINEALEPINPRKLHQLPPRELFHTTLASIRLAQLVQSPKTITKADLAQMNSMVEFPELSYPRETAQRLAFLQTLVSLGIAKAEQLSELHDLLPQRAANC